MSTLPAKNGIKVFSFILVLFSSFTGCDDEKNSVTFTGPIKAPIAFAFIDANVVTNTYVPKVRIKLIDPGGKVVTSNGISFNELEILSGVMNLALQKSTLVSKRVPYRFRIIAEAQGYISTMKTVLLTDTKAQYVPVFMVKIDSPPEGVSVLSTPLPVSNHGVVTADIKFQTPVGTNFNEQLTLSIRAGTQLLYNGKEIPNVNEAARIQVAYANPDAPNGGRLFPNGFLVTDAVDKTGDTIATPNNPFLFASAGWVSANIQLMGLEINGFSQPVEGAIGINSQLINSDTQREFREGDKIPLWSLDTAGAWRLEQEAEVQSENGQLLVKFPMSHLSTWNIDQKVNTCDEDVKIWVDNRSAMDRALYADIVNARTGSKFMMTSAGDCTNNTVFRAGIRRYTVSRASRTIDLALVIYANSTMDIPLASSEVITECDSPNHQTNPVILPALPTPFCTNIFVQINFDENPLPVCNNAIWYRPTSGNPNDPWRLLDFLDNGRLLTTRIDGTVFYDFKIWYITQDASGAIQEQAIEFSADNIAFDPTINCGAVANISSMSNATRVEVRKICSRTSQICSSGCGNCPGTDEITVQITIDTSTLSYFSTCVP